MNLKSRLNLRSDIRHIALLKKIGLNRSSVRLIVSYNCPKVGLLLLTESRLSPIRPSILSRESVEFIFRSTLFSTSLRSLSLRFYRDNILDS